MSNLRNLIGLPRCLKIIDNLHKHIKKIELENKKLRKCVEHYAENGYSKAIACLKELE